MNTDSAAVTRLRARSWPYVAAAIAMAAVVVYLSAWGRRYGLDLKVYRDAVSVWARGDNPYLRLFTARRLAFTYPPFALVALWPLTWASFPVAQWLLWTASIFAAAGSVVLVLRDSGAEANQRLWCEALAWSGAAIIALEPARSGIDYGQIEFILMFIVVADLLVVPSRYRGIAVGLAAAIKLTPLVFVLFLVVSRDVKSVIRAVVSFMAWTAISWLLWPKVSRVYWLHDVGHLTRIGSVTFRGNQSWFAILHRPPFAGTGSALVWLLLAFVTVAVGSFVAWRCVLAGQRALAVVAIALTGLLISPVSWTHHWIWVLLIPPMMVGDRSSAAPAVVRKLLWGLVVLAIAAPYWWFGSGIGADVLADVLPLWAVAVLGVWAWREFAAWRSERKPAPALVS